MMVWWMTYVGAIAGIVGTLTGAAGLVIAIISYRRVTKMKALDLRVDLRKAEIEAAELLDQLPQLLDYAHQSRLAVAAATGVLGSGGIEVWKTQVETDSAAVRKLQSGFKPAGAYDALAPVALESKLIQTHHVLTTAKRYTEKYRAALAADDKEREHIRADHRRT